MFLKILFPFLLFASVAAASAEPAAEPVVFGFEREALDSGWETAGNVRVVTGDAYRQAGSLRLERTPEEIHLPLRAASPGFPMLPGIWDIAAAGKVDIVSPDSSYNGKIWLEILAASGERINRIPIADFQHEKNWTEASRRVELPEGAVKARFVLEMNKTHGVFQVDDLRATHRGAGRSATETVDRILFSTAQMGNLLYPDDPRTVKVEVETFRPLPEDLRTVTAVVRDYWGAEHSVPLTAPLKPVSNTAYEASIDLAETKLEIGRYYELHASVPQPEGKPASNHTSFAILPEAPNKKYPPEKIPFTSRNWDNRVAEYYTLTDRIGIRICGVWGRFSADPPYTAIAPRIDLVKKFGMGALTTTPIALIEHRRTGWEKYDETALRQGIRNLIAAIGDVRPLVINLGNEPPHHDREHIKRMVEAYKVVYQEIKKIDPSIFVVGSSAGPVEEFFQAGFGEWCDAYDFHTYSAPEVVRSSIRRYHELFEKYGHPKPIWSTEIGLNSQGLARRAVAVDMIKKFAGFFAEGGANMSWFGFIYPDPHLQLHGGSEDAHNVFDCRYSRYAPKLDALTYYQMVNGIGPKKFVEEKTYPQGVHATLFRDEGGRSFQVLWRDQGNMDVFVPLDGAGEVRAVRIDGHNLTMDAGKKGVTLSVGPDPVLIEYVSASEGLAEALGEPHAVFEGMEPALVLGNPSAAKFRATRKDISVSLSAPPFWTFKPTAEGGVLTPPPVSNVREAFLSLPLKNSAGKVVGELHRIVPVSGKLGMRLLPNPADSEKGPGLRILLANKGSTKLEASWAAEITGERTLKEGEFGPAEQTNVAFARDASGQLTIPPGEKIEVILPMPGVDPSKLYRIRAKAGDSEGGSLEVERLLGGFVGVARTADQPVADGRLDEAAWKTAPVVAIDQANHFRALTRAKRPPTGSWTGPEDLSAKARFLWDDEFLYLGIEVRDDVAGARASDRMIWSQDGLQFLIDPFRDSASKAGKHDYAVALGANGPQAWSFTTADPVKAPVGEVGDFRIAIQPAEPGSGNLTYEIAIPWNRLAPFQPESGEGFGFTLIFNEDDGQGRDSFLTWFGDAHTKQLDTAGDLILLPDQASRQ